MRRDEEHRHAAPPENKKKKRVSDLGCSPRPNKREHPRTRGKPLPQSVDPAHSHAPTGPNTFLNPQNSFFPQMMFCRSPSRQLGIYQSDNWLCPHNFRSEWFPRYNFAERHLLHLAVRPTQNCPSWSVVTRGNRDHRKRVDIRCRSFIPSVSKPGKLRIFTHRCSALWSGRQLQ